MRAEPREPSDRAGEFEREAERRPRSALAELADFLVHNKKWWLAPIVVLLLLLAAIVALGASGLAPFLYPVF